MNYEPSENETMKTLICIGLAFALLKMVYTAGRISAHIEHLTDHIEHAGAQAES